MKHEYAQFSLKKGKLTFKKAFNMWAEYLLERTINIFTYEGEFEFPPHELELLLQCVGFCGIVKNRQNLAGANKRGVNLQKYVVVYGSGTGVTNYADIFLDFTYATPLFSGLFKIGETGVFCKNNELCLPLKPAITTYAILLAHVDLSIQACLINNRDNKIFITNNQETADSVKEFYNKMTEGATAAVVDKQDMSELLNQESLKFFSVTANKGMTLTELLDARENLLKSFYYDIGISSQKEKRESMTIPEVEHNLCRIQFNISDMLKCRQRICDDMKKVFGVNMTVDINPEIKSQFDIMAGVQSDKEIASPQLESEDNQNDTINSENDNS